MKFTNHGFTEDVSLDYNEFVDCEIKDCAVKYYGGKFSLIRTKLTNVSFGLAGAAGDTLKPWHAVSHSIEPRPPRRG